MEGMMDSIDILSNDLRRLHFHTVGAGYLAEKLYELGYRKPGMSDEEIRGKVRTIAFKNIKLYADEFSKSLEVEDTNWNVLADVIAYEVANLIQTQLDQRGE